MATFVPSCSVPSPSALQRPSLAVSCFSRKATLLFQDHGYGRTYRHKFQVLAVKNAPTSPKKGNASASGPTTPEIPELDNYNPPVLPGDTPDFWEGPQWNWLGFTIEYMWAFGILFAIVACGIAAKTYNSGATDFKQTPVFKEALEAQGGFADDSDSSPGFADAPAEAPALKD